MARSVVYAIATQKGGVGKTTTAVNLGVGLALAGKKVLLVDADSQGDLATCLGLPEDAAVPLSKLMDRAVSGKPINAQEGVLHSREGVDVLPATSELADTEIDLADTAHRETILKQTLNEIKQNYDYVIIDCPPRLNLMALNALCCADKVIIPVIPQSLPAKGMRQLLETVRQVQEVFNPGLRIGGILFCAVEGQTNLARKTAAQLREEFGGNLPFFNATIPKSVKAAEATGMGKSIHAHNRTGPVAAAYRALAQEVMRDARIHDRSSR